MLTCSFLVPANYNLFHVVVDLLQNNVDNRLSGLQLNHLPLITYISNCEGSSLFYLNGKVTLGIGCSDYL
ncbi:hypothetical protein D3C86_2150470 [compost metagenome]